MRVKFLRELVVGALVLLLISSRTFSADLFPAGKTLSLDDAVALALQNQPDLLAAQQNVNAAMSGKSAARADYWPVITFQGDYVRGNFIPTLGPASSLLVSVYTLYYDDFNATVTLLDFGKRFAQVGEADANLAEAIARYHQARSKVIFDAAKAYFTLVEAQATVRVRTDALSAAQKHLELAKGFVATGEQSKIALAKAEVVYSRAEYDFLRAKNDMDNAVIGLNQAMGIANPPEYQVDSQVTTPPVTLDLMQSKALAFQIRPELLASEARVSAAQARVNVLRAQRWPVLSGFTDYGWLDDVFPPKSKSWDLGLQLNWTLFNGNKLGQQIQQAIYQKNNAEEQEASLRIQIEKEVEENFRAIGAAQDRMDAATQEVNAAEESEALALARYKEGLGSPVELADAEADLTRAQADLLQAEADYRIAQSALKQSVGVEAP